MSDATLWEQYVDAYHKFWNYLEENEWVLQEGTSVILVRRAMEDCPVVNFSCVRDLIYTMRQFLGEKRFKDKESQWRANLNLMVDRCINNDICNLTVEVKHPYSFHQEACDDTMSYKGEQQWTHYVYLYAVGPLRENYCKILFTPQTSMIHLPSCVRSKNT